MIGNSIKVLKILVIIFCLLKSIAVYAEEQLNVPKDEIAQESVYPIFDTSDSVKNRNIEDIKTFDVGLFAGAAITEPIANTVKYGVAINYHFNEAHSLGLLWAKNNTGLSKDAESLKNDFGLDFSRAPFPEYSILTDYNYKMFYGKLSITKNGVLNTSIYTSASVGAIKYIHKTYPVVAFGVGERFYLTKKISLKLDLRFFVNNAPVPFKAGALRTGIDPVPSYDSFDEKVAITTNLELGLNYLF